MCSSTTLKFLQDTVKKFVDEDRLFTAFDITIFAKKYAREKGSDLHERHRELKNDIHELIEPYVLNGTYQKQLWDVGAPTKAFLYHPPGADPASYVPLSRTDTPKTATTALPQITTPPTTDDSDDDGDCVDIGRKPDSRGCVTVPSYLLRASGFAHKDTAYVYADNNQVVLSKDSNGVGFIGHYTVDYHNNVRITQFTLAKAGLDGKTYDFESNADKVIIKEHV